MFVVGLTGDVGAGKSTLAGAWRALGAHVIDADAVAKRQWLKPEIREKAASRWGSDMLRDEGVNFAKIAEIAFADETEYRYMINLVHPGTRVDLTREATSLRGWIVAEIQLLFEAGRHDWIDYVVYATAPEKSRLQRNRVRGWGDGEIKRRERFLLDSARKQEMADLVMNNDSTLESWGERAERTGRMFLAMSSVREVVTFCASFAEAEKLAHILVENRLVACANIEEVKSCYRWRRRVETSTEWSLLCKTTEAAMRKAIQCIKANHSYELPAITARDICGADAATLRWVVESCE